MIIVAFTYTADLSILCFINLFLPIWGTIRDASGTLTSWVGRKPSEWGISVKHWKVHPLGRELFLAWSSCIIRFLYYPSSAIRISGFEVGSDLRCPPTIKSALTKFSWWLKNLDLGQPSSLVRPHKLRAYSPLELSMPSLSEKADDILRENRGFWPNK